MTRLFVSSPHEDIWKAVHGQYALKLMDSKKEYTVKDRV